MTAQEKRNQAVSYMTSRKGRNSYTQGAKRKYFFGYPDNAPGNTRQKGFSDCSSSVRAAIRAAAGIDIGGNTSAQINNRARGKIVHETTGCYPDESKLLPGDCLYFKGNTSHPLDVGHVEMYVGNGKCCGHGSGTGPVVHSMKAYCKGRANAKRRYFMAIRWIPDDAPGGGAPDATPGGAPVENTEGKEEMMMAQKVRVIGATVNLREGPGVKYGIADVVKLGEELDAVGPKDGWIPVLAGGELKWVSGKYVKYVQEV